MINFKRICSYKYPKLFIAYLPKHTPVSSSQSSVQREIKRTYSENVDAINFNLRATIEPRSGNGGWSGLLRSWFVGFGGDVFILLYLVYLSYFRMNFMIILAFIAYLLTYITSVLKILCYIVRLRSRRIRYLFLTFSSVTWLKLFESLFISICV